MNNKENMLYAKTNYNAKNLNAFSHFVTASVNTIKATSPVCYVSGQQQSNIGDCIT